MRAVITRPRLQAGPLAEALQAVGIEPVYFPTVRIAPADHPEHLDAALQRRPGYDWIIFTSVNAVRAVWERLAQMDISFPAGSSIAAIGPKTAAGLEEHGMTPTFIPQEFIAEAVVPGLKDLKGKSVLLPLSDLAEDTLKIAVEAAGGTAEVVTAYKTLPAASDPNGLAALHSGVDAVIFTSGSTARSFAVLVESSGLNPFALPGSPIFACIGPKTAAAARELGFKVDVVALEHTIEGLVSTLCFELKKLIR